MYINTFVIKFQNIAHVTNRLRNGTPCDEELHPSLVECFKCNQQIPRDLHFIYSFYIEKDLRTVDGSLCDTFSDAAWAIRLLEHFTEHQSCLQ